MKCEECLRLLDLHLDGELSPRDAADVAGHLGTCELCARRYQSLRDEQALYLRYGCDSTESPSFWDEVLARAEAERAPGRDTRAARLRRRFAEALTALAAPRFSPTVTAAMLVAAVGLTAVVMKYVRPRDSGPNAAATSERKGDIGAAELLPVVAGNADAGGVTDGAEVDDADKDSRRQIAEGRHGARGRAVPAAKGAGTRAAKVVRRTPAPVASDAEPEKLVREAERKYLAAIATLSRDVGRRRARMDPETVTRFERTLAVVDRAIAETRAAARRHPRDPVVVQYMMAAYSRKVDLLRELARE